MSNKELSQLAQLSLSAATDLTCIAECLSCSGEIPLWWTTKLATALAYVAVLKESLSMPEEVEEEGETEENEISEDSLTDSPEEQETEEVEEPEEEDMLPPSYRMVSYAP